jgi:hypothetical protein
VDGESDADPLDDGLWEVDGDRLALADDPPPAEDEQAAITQRKVLSPLLFTVIAWLSVAAAEIIRYAKAVPKSVLSERSVQAAPPPSAVKL